MLFNSLEFLVFLIAVFGLYWLPVRKDWWQNAVVVGASLFFYAYWDWRVLGLFVGSISFTMFVARRIAKLHENRGGAKKWLVMSIALLLGVLGVFKYYNFFAETFAKMFGFASDSLTLSLILPLGISFYTFMCISYLVDTKNGLIPHPSTSTSTSTILSTFTYLTFFPQIASGPIGRGPVMLPQFAAPRTFDYALAVEGCRQMLWGFFKKILVADTCSIVVAEMMKSSQESSVGIWVGAIVYTIQIYADFSGYSDMAIGCGKLFGIRLMRNFAYPYFATNIGDFWRRWHMTLTRWFTDYVYIPLGGSRCSKPRQIFNTLVVFLTSGLWHGAAWNFVAWGGAHGAFFIPKILKKKTVHSSTSTSNFNSFLSWALLMFCVTLGWVLFQAPDFATAGHWFSMMFYKLNFSLKGAGLATCGLEKAILFSALMFAWELVSREQEVVKMPRSTVLRYSVYLALPLLIFLFYPQANNFIYFQF